MNEVPNTSASETSSADHPTSQLSAEIVTAIQKAVEQAFAAKEKMPPPPAWPSSSPLLSQANSLLSAGTAPSHSGAVGGKSPMVVPSFMTTFSSASAVPALTPNVMGSASTDDVSASPSVQYSIVPTLHQPFVVGLGYSPIPAKLVSQIVGENFINLNDLLPANLTPASEPEPQVLFDERLVFTSAQKKPKRRFEDITSSNIVLNFVFQPQSNSVAWVSC
jgi:hypothetical protein